MTAPSLAEHLLAGLGPGERRELESLLYALDVVHQQDHAPGQFFDADGLTDAIRQMSPPVRATLAKLNALVEVPRIAPFQPKLTQSDYANLLGLDKSTLGAVKDTIDLADASTTLISRMGSDRDTPSKPPSRRDEVADAVEQHQPHARAQTFADAELADAGSDPSLSMRDVLTTAVELKENSL